MGAWDMVINPKGIGAGRRLLAAGYRLVVRERLNRFQLRCDRTPRWSDGLPVRADPVFPEGSGNRFRGEARPNR